MVTFQLVFHGVMETVGYPPCDPLFYIYIWYSRNYMMVVYGGCIIICCRFHIYPMKSGFSVFYYCAYNKVYYDPMFAFASFTPPHYHHNADLAASIVCQVHSLSSVCLRLSHFSQVSFMQYMGLCVFSLPPSRMVIVRIHVLYPIIIMQKEHNEQDEHVYLCNQHCACWWSNSINTERGL